MEATNLRKLLIEKIKNADDEKLKAIKTLLDEQEQIVAYNVQGQSLSQDDFNKEIAEAEVEYEKGNYTTLKQLKEEIKTWKNSMDK